MTTVNASLSVKTIWGKVVLFLREHRQVALHVACGDITDVELEGNKLIVNVYDGMLVNLLQEGRREIESALRWQGLELQLEVRTKEKFKSDEEQDIEKLKEVFGEYLILKGDR